MYVKKVVIEDGITEIGDEAFGGCMHLNSVSIANGVERIGNGAFDFARELTSITLPSSLKTIGDNAFINSGLTRMIVPNGVTHIGKLAFNGNKDLEKLILPASINYMGDATDMGPMSGCPKLTSATDLGGGGAIEFGFTKIPDNSFAGCEDLETVSFPSGLTEIGDQAFKYCKKIKTLAFPAGTKVIGVDAFYSCTDLEKLIIPGTVDTIKLNGEEYDGTTRAPFYKCEKLLTVGPAGDGNTYDITYGWTDIPAYAFFMYPQITSVTFKPGLKSIGRYAFAWDINISQIILPDGVEAIGRYAFSGCIGLSKIRIPASVMTMGDIENSSLFPEEAFEDKPVRLDDGQWTYGEYYLFNSPWGAGISENIKTAGPIGDGNTYDYEFGWTTEIPDMAFKNLASIESITLPDTLTKIGRASFRETMKLESIDIPSGVNSIGDDAFAHSGLKSVIIPDIITKIERRAFFQNLKLETVHLPENLIDIDDFAFAYNECLQNINVPESLVRIGGASFIGTGCLNPLILPEGFERIEEWAFFYSGVGKIHMPLSTKFIADSAFESSNPLLEVFKDTYSHKYVRRIGINHTVLNLDGTPADDSELSEVADDSSGLHNTDEAPIQKSEVALGDTRVELIFDLDGGKADSCYTVDGNKIKLLKPEKEGYTFKSWTDGSKKVKALSEKQLKYSSAINLKANWVENAYTVKFNLSKPAAGAKLINKPRSMKTKYSSEITIPAGISAVDKEGNTYVVESFTDQSGKLYKPGEKVSKLAGKNKKDKKVLLIANWSMAK